MNKHRKKHSKQKDHNLLPYKTILAATRGDPDAVSAVLQHYDGYITRMSLRRLYDDHGNVFLCVDEAIRRWLEIKLIAGILTFRAA